MSRNGSADPRLSRVTVVVGYRCSITLLTNVPPQHPAGSNGYHTNTHQQWQPPTKKCLNFNQQHRALAATCPDRKQVIHQKTKTKKIHETEKSHRTYLDIAKTAIQQTNQPTPALTLSSKTHIKLATLIIGAHIASLAKLESYGSILSKSLKINSNIDTSYPGRDSQKIFNLFINPRTKVETNKGDHNEVWEQISVSKIHLNHLPIYVIPQHHFDEIPHSSKHLTHKRPKHLS
ncbi:hypothetical protein FHG87_014589 [Trinorchestia longiramus]|nr:hypothetical protein FHG87_014589 [Trinorchestia longiramus]